MGKVKVGVDYNADADGVITPIRIHWSDGRAWDIDRVLHTCRSPDRSFEGIRYTVLISGTEKYLYLARNNWYVNAAM